MAVSYKMNLTYNNFCQLVLSFTTPFDVTAVSQLMVTISTADGKKDLKIQTYNNLKKGEVVTITVPADFIAQYQAIISQSHMGVVYTDSALCKLIPGVESHELAFNINKSVNSLAENQKILQDRLILTTIPIAIDIMAEIIKKPGQPKRAASVQFYISGIMMSVVDLALTISDALTLTTIKVKYDIYSTYINVKVSMDNMLGSETFYFSIPK